MAIRERLPYVAASVIALLLFWQASSLEAWTFLGPGPGLFPQLTTGFCAIVALLIACFPGTRAPAAPAEEEPDAAAGSAEQRLFLIYCLALPFLAIAAAHLGFILMSVALALALTWWAERRGWLPAFVFGLACGILGVVVFGRLLGATVPELALESALLRLFR
ncbi:MAG: tripartite tricarboxylate transporter TctB family protein [Alphaproteobacteria bacterium]|nr:tripartite tricarboxylate transporter TctB family protein [Alphaproteobacteria bacterium]